MRDRNCVKKDNFKIIHQAKVEILYKTGWQQGTFPLISNPLSLLKLPCISLDYQCGSSNQTGNPHAHYHKLVPMSLYGN